MGPKFWAKLHESEIEPINIDINSALDWGWKESPVFPSVHSLVPTYNWEMQDWVDPNPGGGRERKMCLVSGERKVAAWQAMIDEDSDAA